MTLTRRHLLAGAAATAAVAAMPAAAIGAVETAPIDLSLTTFTPDAFAASIPHPYSSWLGSNWGIVTWSQRACGVVDLSKDPA